jgi:hypothetical protein
MNIYTVEQGEQGMGGSVAGVYGSQAVAVKAAERLMAEQGGGYEASTSQVLTWNYGGDYVRVVERPVVGEIDNPIRYMRERLADTRAQLHSARVGLKFPAGSVERIVGYLHDVVEDSGTTVADIREVFGEAVASGVDAVTRREDEVYADFIDRAARHPVGRFVKLEDVRDNLSTLADGHSLQSRYERALEVLL